jgi:hypothetical protein
MQAPQNSGPSGPRNGATPMQETPPPPAPSNLGGNITVSEKELESMIASAVRTAIGNQRPNQRSSGKSKRARTNTRAPPARGPRLWSKVFAKPNLAEVFLFQNEHHLYKRAAALLSDFKVSPDWVYHENDTSRSGASYLLLSELPGVYRWGGFTVPFRPHTGSSHGFQVRLAAFMDAASLNLSGFDIGSFNSLLLVHYPINRGTGTHTDDPADSAPFVANFTLGGPSQLTMLPGTPEEFKIHNGDGQFTIFDSYRPHAAGNCHSDQPPRHDPARQPCAWGC